MTFYICNFCRDYYYNHPQERKLHLPNILNPPLRTEKQIIDLFTRVLPVVNNPRLNQNNLFIHRTLSRNPSNNFIFIHTNQRTNSNFVQNQNNLMRSNTISNFSNLSFFQNNIRFNSMRGRK